jgi:hypothetical protein
VDPRPNMVAARHDHPGTAGRGHHRLHPLAHPTEVGVNAIPVHAYLRTQPATHTVTCARTACSWRAAMNGTLVVRGLPLGEVYHLRAGNVRLDRLHDLLGAHLGFIPTPPRSPTSRSPRTQTTNDTTILTLTIHLVEERLAVLASSGFSQSLISSTAAARRSGLVTALGAPLFCGDVW